MLQDIYGHSLGESPWDFSDEATARIYFADCGGPIRTLFGMAHRHIFAINRDPKTNWPNPTEGVTERAWAMRCATDPDVFDYQTQPFRIELVVKGKLVSWIPDYWVLWRSGTIEIGEVKVDVSGLVDAAYESKLAAAFNLLNRSGWDACVRYSDKILGTTDRQINVGTLYPDRASTIDQEHRAAFRRLMTDGASLCFGDLVEALDAARPMQSQAVAHRLICMGRVWADLDELLTEDSSVVLRSAVNLPNPFRMVTA